MCTIGRICDGRRPKTARRIREAGAAGPPPTGAVLNINAAVWNAGFHWWRSGNKKRTQNVSEYMLVLALCLVYNVCNMEKISNQRCGKLASHISLIIIIRPPCGQAIIFCSCGFYLLLSSFFPCLFSAVTDWRSTILPHMT